MPALAERLPAAPLSTGMATSFAGNADFHRCLCDLIDSAEHEIADYVIPESRPDEHDKHILRAYGGAVRRGVNCRNLIAPEHLALVQSTWDANFNLRDFLAKTPHIRVVDKVSGPFTIIDRRKVLLNLANAMDPGEYTTSVVIDDAKLAASLLATFDALWADAEGNQANLVEAWEAR